MATKKELLAFLKQLEASGGSGKPPEAGTAQHDAADRALHEGLVLGRGTGGGVRSDIHHCTKIVITSKGERALKWRIPQAWLFIGAIVVALESVISLLGSFRSLLSGG